MALKCYANDALRGDAIGGFADSSFGTRRAAELRGLAGIIIGIAG